MALQNRWRWFTCVWVVEILACQQSSYQGSRLVSGEDFLDSCPVFPLFSASQLQVSYSFRVSTFPPSTVSQFLCFPSFARKWPPDQPFSELCLNRCNTKNWNQILLIAHVKGRKTILASQLPALGRPASVWEDKEKTSASAALPFFLFFIYFAFYHDWENLANSVQGVCLWKYTSIVQKQFDKGLAIAAWKPC